MRWYVFHDSTGWVEGPMSEDSALSKDGMAFSEKLFSPTFDIIPDAEELINVLRAELLVDNSPVDDRILSLFQRSIDMITILSREEV